MTTSLGFRTPTNLHKASAGTSGRCTPFTPVSTTNAFRHNQHRAGALALRRSAASERAYSTVEVVRLRKSLQQELDAAVKTEDYSRAAAVKKELAELDAADPVAQGLKALQDAIAQERYQEAAKIQAQLKQLETELGAAALDSPLLSTTSNTVTRGVRVHVESFYWPANSDPASSRYMFAYRVNITNESDKVVQLRQRHWVIMDANGKLEEVRGPGVVGEQPVLVPGKAFQYTSGCPLTTQQGSMEGEYTCFVLDEADGEWKETIEVKIGKFKLDFTGPAAV